MSISNVLNAGEVRHKGTWLTSSNGNYEAGLDDDGRFVIRYVTPEGPVLIWSNKVTAVDGSRGVPHLAMSPLGFLTVWDGHTVARWSSPSQGSHDDTQFFLDDDGQGLIRNVNNVNDVKWRTGSRTYPTTEPTIYRIKTRALTEESWVIGIESGSNSLQVMSGIGSDLNKECWIVSRHHTDPLFHTIVNPVNGTFALHDPGSSFGAPVPTGPASLAYKACKWALVGTQRDNNSGYYRIAAASSPNRFLDLSRSAKNGFVTAHPSVDIEQANQMWDFEPFLLPPNTDWITTVQQQHAGKLLLARVGAFGKPAQVASPLEQAFWGSRYFELHMGILENSGADPFLVVHSAEASRIPKGYCLGAILLCFQTFLASMPGELIVLDIRNTDKSTVAKFSNAFKNDYTQFPADLFYNVVKGENSKRFSEIQVDDVKGRIMILSDSLFVELKGSTLDYLSWAAAWGDE